MRKQTHIWEELQDRDLRDFLLGKSDQPDRHHYLDGLDGDDDSEGQSEDNDDDGEDGDDGDDNGKTFFWLLVASSLSSFSCWSLNRANFSSFSA